jgi:hypothetical protein
MNHPDYTIVNVSKKTAKDTDAVKTNIIELRNNVPRMTPEEQAAYDAAVIAGRQEIRTKSLNKSKSDIDPKVWVPIVEKRIEDWDANLVKLGDIVTELGVMHSSEYKVLYQKIKDIKAKYHIYVNKNKENYGKS